MWWLLVAGALAAPDPEPPPSATSTTSPTSADEGAAVRAPIHDGDPADFADHLLASGDPFNALTWYRLALFRGPPRADVGTLRFRMALCYELGDRHDAAEAAWLALADDHPQLADRALYRAAMAQLAAERPAVARMHLDDVVHTAPGSAWSERAALMEGAAWLEEGRLDEGGRALRRFVSEHPGSPWTLAAAEAAAVAEERVRYRSPLVAGVASTVLPGAGQLYAGNPGDAFMAFVAAGVLGGWSASLLAYGVEADRPWALASGSALGAAAAFTWAGNVVGAVRGARRTNAFHRRQAAGEARAVLRDPHLEVEAEDVEP